MVLSPLLKDLRVLRLYLRQYLRRKASLLCMFINCTGCSEKQVLHVCSPFFSFLFFDKREFSKMVSITQAVSNLFVRKIGKPMVVNRCSGEILQDAHLVHGLLAPFGIHAI